MTLTIASNIASDSLGVLQDQLAIVSRNIAGANSKNYSAKSANIVTSAEGAPTITHVSRLEDLTLLRRVLGATSQSSSSDTAATILADIEAAIVGQDTGGADGSNASPSAKLAALKSALQQYSGDPSNTGLANAALAAAKSVVSSLNTVAGALQKARQQADDQTAVAVGSVNRLLAQFQELNGKIVSGSVVHADVTELQDQRDGILKELSQYLGLSIVMRPNNDMLLYTDSGVTLFETTARSVTFQQTPALSAQTSAHSVFVDGVPIAGPSATFPLGGGTLQGLANIRDTVVPGIQAQFDELARGLIAAFSESDQSGGAAPTLPGLFISSQYVSPPTPSLIPGLSSTIAINPNADPSQGGDVTRIRDGGIANPAMPAYRYNNPGGSGGVGFSGRILSMISALSANRSFDGTASLGVTGSVNSYAASISGSVASSRQQAEQVKSYHQSVLTETVQSLSDSTGVNIDEQMAKMLSIENSYQASAKLLATINSMFDVLFTAIRA